MTIQYNTIQYNTIQSKDLLLIFKNGKFYNTYKDDAIILNYLFGYKILKDDKAGFPENTLTKVINTLEEKKIDYEVISKSQNPISKKYGTLNNYHKIKNQAYEYASIQTRIKRLNEKINEITDINILNNLLEILENELSK